MKNVFIIKTTVRRQLIFYGRSNGAIIVGR